MIFARTAVRPPIRLCRRCALINVERLAVGDKSPTERQVSCEHEKTLTAVWGRGHPAGQYLMLTYLRTGLALVAGGPGFPEGEA